MKTFCGLLVLAAVATIYSECATIGTPETGTWMTTWDVDEEVVTCMYIQSELSVIVYYNNTDNERKSVQVFVPANATNKDSQCSTDFDSLILDFFNDWKLTIEFTNKYELGCANWMQFAIHRLELKANLTGHPEFVNPNPASLSSWMATVSGIDTCKEWRGNFSTVGKTSMECEKPVEASVPVCFNGTSPALFTFRAEHSFISAFANTSHVSNKDDLPSGMTCIPDTMVDDRIWVIIGTVQTATVFSVLFFYLIWLSRRDVTKIEVPRFLLEPSMRTAKVNPMGEQEYERKMTAISQTISQQDANNPSYIGDDGDEKRKVTWTSENGEKF